MTKRWRHHQYCI